MGGVVFFTDFFVWYYTRAFVNIVSVWSNFMWFILHFFSLPLLVRTLFLPWKRMTDLSRHRSIEDWLSGVVMNIMSRVFGAVIRLCIIGVGICLLCIGVCALCVVLVLWVSLPFLSVLCVWYGLFQFII